MPKRPAIQKIAIIGFGEVGGIFGTDFAKQGIDVRVFDILLNARRSRPQMMAKARSCGVRAVDSLQDCLPHAELVISAVTTSSSLKVAKDASSILSPGQLFLDINSVSPETKRKAGTYVERSTAHFIEAAVMAPVAGQRLKVPMLLGGAHAAKCAERINSIGMNAIPVSDQIGIASAIKMCRSVMMKGLEALAVECLFAARQYGAEDAVLKSLADTYPSLGWQDELPDYLISRVAEHGKRRAAEMREVARALRAVGIEPWMALATATRQEKLVRKIAQRKLRIVETQSFSWRSLADAVAPAARRKLTTSRRKRA